MLDDLYPKYRLSYLIGEIVRNDVWVESEMRMVWKKLRAVGLLADDLQRDYGRLIKQVRKPLALPETPEPFRTIALEVIDAAQGAHKRRSVLAHDILMVDVVDDSRVRSLRSLTPTRPLAELAAFSEELKTLAWRTRGLWIIAPQWIGGPLDDYETRDGLPSWTRVAMGHIRTDVPDRILGIAGDTPEPPGGFR